MDTFLTGLYHEEMEKGASSQMGEFMDSLPAGDLEQYLGLDKLAVGGSSNPPLPDSAQGAELDAKQKAVNENCCKEHLSSIPKRSDGADPSVSFQSEGKQPTESPDEAKQVSKQAMACADYVGRMFAKTAGGGMEKDDAFTSPEAKAKARLMSATMKIGKGESAAVRKASLSRAGQMKISEGDDMETLAAARAEIAARALRSTSGAPQHIKMAAAALAGRQIAKLAAKPDWYDRGIQARQSRTESKGLQGAVGGAGGGFLGQSIAKGLGHSTKGRLLGGAIGALGGVGLGLGGAALAKKRRMALKKM